MLPWNHFSAQELSHRVQEAAESARILACPVSPGRSIWESRPFLGGGFPGFDLSGLFLTFSQDVCKLKRNHLSGDGCGRRFEAAAGEAAQQQPSSSYVFPGPTGGPIAPDSVLHMLHRVLDRAGLPEIRFHDLRHAVIGQLAERNILMVISVHK